MAEPKTPAKPQEKKPESKAVVKQVQEDQPEYQEKIMFLVSTTAQGPFYFGVSACCLLDI